MLLCTILAEARFYSPWGPLWGPWDARPYYEEVPGAAYGAVPRASLFDRLQPEDVRGLPYDRGQMYGPIVPPPAPVNVHMGAADRLMERAPGPPGYDWSPGPYQQVQGDLPPPVALAGPGPLFYDRLAASLAARPYDSVMPMQSRWDQRRGYWNW